MTLDLLNAIELSRPDYEAAIEALDRFGVCVVRNYLNADRLQQLVVEHANAFDSKDKGVYLVQRHPTNEDGLVARCKLLHLGDGFSQTIRIFNSNFMKNVANTYFGNTPVALNEDIFFTHEKASEKAILPWHFDRQQALKFYINLIDVDENNGAFEYDIGSHREGHFRANFYVLSGIKIGEIPNDIPERELRNPIVIAAKAGDLVIFDADGFHRGGIVSKGEERKVVRGHTRPMPLQDYQPRFPEANWWLNSPLNISKYLGKKAIRRLSNERLTTSARRR